MNSSESTVACKLTLDTLDVLLRRFTANEAARFARALLTSTYNGEDWYYVEANLSAPFAVQFEKQILRKTELDELFTTDWQHSHSMWFRIVKK